MSEAPRRNRSGRRLAWQVSLALIAVTGGWWLFRAPALSVETSVATLADMEVTVDQEAEVRVHDRYVIAAPAAGRVVRTRFHDGDPVSAGEVVAELSLAPLDPRDREQALAQARSAQAAVVEAEQQARQADAALLQANRDALRLEQLARENFVAAEAVDRAHTNRTSAQASLAAARAHVAGNRADLDVARARLLSVPAPDGRALPAIPLVSPVAGRILLILEPSERTLAAGTPIVVVGDPARFEIVADVLSSDAVRIPPGADARLSEWGGPVDLRARVRTIEPHAFTKVSALGIEEKRVNVVLDPLDPLGALGDGYRVVARIMLWRGSKVLTVPESALFRHGDGEAVFVVRRGKALLAPVRVGRRNGRMAEILAGLDPGTAVIRYPDNALSEGARVRSQVER
ncbi:MAG: HlyD family efflux transporter periplasmic adaptor subunit [Betaproteobacteria bacterium]